MEGFLVRNGRTHGLLFLEDDRDVCLDREVCRILGEAEPLREGRRMEHVRIDGFGCAWQSDFDLESTIGVGLRRWVTDRETGANVGFVEYRGYGRFIIHCFLQSIEVEINGENYLFRHRNNTAMVIAHREDPKSIVVFENQEFGKTFDVVYPLGADEKILLMLLAMPRIRFAV